MLIDIDEESYKDLTKTIQQADAIINEAILYKKILGLITAAIQLNKVLAIDNSGLTIDGIPISQLLKGIK